MRAGWIAVLAMASAGIVTAAPPLTPGTVARSIHERGARRTIDDLQKRGRWEVLTDAIDRGDSAWIALAPMLAPGSDAGSAEDLGLSLAFALPNNPAAVLAALDDRNGHILGADRVCGRPFIEDTEPEGYRTRSIAALLQVRQARLRASKQACLTALRAIR